MRVTEQTQALAASLRQPLTRWSPPWHRSPFLPPPHLRYYTFSYGCATQFHFRFYIFWYSCILIWTSFLYIFDSNCAKAKSEYKYSMPHILYLILCNCCISVIYFRWFFFFFLGSSRFARFEFVILIWCLS